MKLIINIPDHIYNAIKEYPMCYTEEVFRWIKNGKSFEEELEKIKEKIIEDSFKHPFELGEYYGEDTRMWFIIKTKKALSIIDDSILELKGNRNEEKTKM